MRYKSYPIASMRVMPWRCVLYTKRTGQPFVVLVGFHPSQVGLYIPCLDTGYTRLLAVDMAYESGGHPPDLLEHHSNDLFYALLRLLRNEKLTTQDIKNIRRETSFCQTTCLSKGIV